MNAMSTTPTTLARCAAIGALALAATAIAQADKPAEGTVPLDTITVTGRAPPLDRSLYLLRILVEQSAPCLGCDAVLQQARTPPAIRLLNYLLMPAEPPPVSEAERLAFEIKLKDSPELEFLRP